MELGNQQPGGGFTGHHNSRQFWKFLRVVSTPSTRWQYFPAILLSLSFFSFYNTDSISSNRESSILTDVPPEHVLYLLLLKPSLDDELVVGVHGTTEKYRLIVSEFWHRSISVIDCIY